MKGKTIGWIFAITMFCSLAAMTASGAELEVDVPYWPSRDAVLTIPASKGSALFLYGEIFKDFFEKGTGKKLSLRSLPAQAGAAAWAQMQDDPQDGTVLTLIVLPNLSLRSLSPETGIKMDSLTVCRFMATAPVALWTRASSAIRSPEDIAVQARRSDKPFLIGGPGSSSIGELANLNLDRQLGIKTLYVPYAGSREAAEALERNEITLFWGMLDPDFAATRALRAIAVAGTSHSPGKQGEFPLFRELGLELAEEAQIAIAVPAGTSPYTLQDMDEFFDALVASPEYTQKLAAHGFSKFDITRSGCEEHMQDYLNNLRSRLESFEGLL